MSLLALHHHADEWEVRRYGAAALAIIALHLALIAAAVFWYERAAPAGVTMQPIFVELAPAPSAPQVSAQDIAPGPEAEQAEPPPAPQKIEKVEEQVPPTPLQAEAVVAAPPRVEPEPRPEPVKPPPVIKEAKKPAKKPPAPRTTAAPKAERIARETPAQASGASAAAAASYRSILASHLQRFKQYPGDARARGEQGTASVTFTMTRDGRVTSSRLTRSSGHAALDQETVALIRRAQPLPPFPPELTLRADTFTVPFSYTIR